MVVNLRFVMKNEAGDMIEDTMNSDPVQYLHGSGSILPSLEKGIEGLHEGDIKHLDFTMEGGGYYSMDIFIDKIRPATPEELNIGKPQERVPGEACGPGCCC